MACWFIQIVLLLLILKGTTNQEGKGQSLSNLLHMMNLMLVAAENNSGGITKQKFFPSNGV